MPPKKKARTASNAKPKHLENVHQSVLGGLNGGYRVTGEEHSNDDNVESFEVPFKGKNIICERRGTKNSKSMGKLIFTHGAGGGLANPATREFVEGFAANTPVVAFQGTMNLKNRTETFHAVIEHEESIVGLGGRSMGARAAVIAATERGGINHLVLVSYPLVGANSSEPRDQILYDLPKDTDVLFLTGSNDSMCRVDHLRQVIEKMHSQCWIVEVEGADHGMSLKPKNGVKPTRVESGAVAANWLQNRSSKERYSLLRWDNSKGKAIWSGWQEAPSSAATVKKGNISEYFETKKRKRQN